jgi:apolipoprotein N-acyltransferase
MKRQRSILPGELSIRNIWFPVTACALTFGFLLCAFPPRQAPETAYFFLVPALWWLSSRPSYKSVFLVFLFFGWLYYLTLLWWLRHVTFSGLSLGALLLSGYLVIWFLFARWIIPHSLESKFGTRLLAMLSLASLWTLIEWGRSKFVLGFPWCPLSVSQWQRPAVLQISEWTGGWAISFFLVFFNLSIASYLHHLLIRRHKPGRKGIAGSMCPDLYVGLVLLAVMLSPVFLMNQGRRIEVPMLRAGFIQPYLMDKWDHGKAARHKETLRRHSNILAATRPDVIFWPEASTPYAINEDATWVEYLSEQNQLPMIVGAITRSVDPPRSYNSVCSIKPIDGLIPECYSKRALVPFGEYIPRGFDWIPNLDKLVGPTGRFESGHDAKTILLDVNSTGKALRVGPLVCYEDIFPDLARETIQKGADFLFISTNNAWFGEEGCAEQHAAHSVLRAIENRRPVLRSGNAGWSGWIDEQGVSRSVMRDGNGSVYFEGAATFSIARNSLRINKETFFSRHENWFVYICFAFTAMGCLPRGGNIFKAFHAVSGRGRP